MLSWLFLVYALNIYCTLFLERWTKILTSSVVLPGTCTAEDTGDYIQGEPGEIWHTWGESSLG